MTIFKSFFKYVAFIAFFHIEQLQAMRRILPLTMRSITSQRNAVTIKKSDSYNKKNITYCLPSESVFCKRFSQKNAKLLVVSNDPATWLVQTGLHWLTYDENNNPIVYAPAYSEKNVNAQLGAPIDGASIDSYVNVINVSTKLDRISGLLVLDDRENYEETQKCIQSLRTLAEKNNGVYPVINSILIGRDMLDKVHTLPAKYLSKKHIEMTNDAALHSWEQKTVISLSEYIKKSNAQKNK